MAVAHPDSGYDHAAPAAPSYAASAAPKAPVVFHASAPTMTTYTIHTYRSPTPKPVVSTPPNYVPVTQGPAYAPAYAPESAPAPAYH